MSYQVIARKWRPQSFQQLVGQSPIAQTLLNSLRNHRLHHALLFTGTRGTGKTSTARILAKTLRCLQPTDFTPCQTCSSCLEITEGRSVDVIEIDGASNNGVDSIRELRETVAFMPSSGKFKIYIIDEVHMLSTSAFNALLKTLEEPPAHVVFILATTDAQKIPATILSRVQRFDFRRISTRDIVQQLEKICLAENIPAETEALWLLAKNGDGSMRDTLSLMEQAISFGEGKIKLDLLTELLGFTDRRLILSIIESLVEQKPDQLWSGLKKLHSLSVEPLIFFKELIENLRHILLAYLGNDPQELAALIDASENEIKDFLKLKNSSSETDLHLLFDMALKGAHDIAKAQDPALVLDVVLLRMLSAPRRFVVDKIDLRNNIAEDEKKKPESLAKSSALPSERAKTQTLTTITDQTPTEQWMAFIEGIRQKEALLAAKLDGILFIKIENKKIFLSIPVHLAFLKDQMKNPLVRQQLQTSIQAFWGDSFTFEVVAGGEDSKGESAQNLNVKKHQEAALQLRENIENHPLVKKAKSVFNGEITSIVKLSDKE